MISNEFLEKHKNNNEMLNIINKVSECMNTNNINTRHHETICEVMYGIKNLYADPYEIPMDGVYTNLSYVKDINYVQPKDLLGTAAGAYYPLEKDENNNYYSKINISEKYKQNANLEREILAHELVHVAVQSYAFDNGKIVDCRENGLIYSHINEICVQDMSSKILEDQGYKLYKFEKTINYDGSVAEELCITSTGYGYSDVSPLAKPLSSVYPKELYQEMFLHESQLHDKLGIGITTAENVLLDMEIKLQKLDTCSGSFEQMNYYSGLYNDCESMLYHKMQNDDTINLSEYLKSAQMFRENSYMVFVDGEPVLLSDTVSQNCEIKAFYKDFNSRANIESEINPTTRSRDCENFLLVMGGVKDSGKLYTPEDLDNLQWTEISSRGNTREIIFQCGEDKYKLTGVKGKGIVIVSELEHTTEIIKNSAILNINKELKEELSFTEMRELSMLTGYGKHVLENETNPKEVVFYSVTDGKMTSNFFDCVNKYEINDLKDNQNNNIYHVLAASLNSNGDDFYSIMEASNPIETKKLLYENNLNGFTPIKEAFKNNNIEFINGLSKSGYSFQGEQADYILKSDKKSYLCALVDNQDYETLAMLVESKVNINSCDNSGTLLHHLAKDNKFKFLNEETLQSITENNTSPNAFNIKGETAITVLTKKHFTYESFDYLINKVGVDPIIPDANDRNALHNLLQQTNKSLNILKIDSEYDKFNKCLDILLEKNIDVNTPCKDFSNDNMKITPLQIACGMNNPMEQPLNYDAIEKLINAGAHVTEHSCGYKSPLEYICNNSDVEAMASFIKAGVPIEALEYTDAINTSSKFYLECLSNNHTVDLDIAEEIKNTIKYKTIEIDNIIDSETSEFDNMMNEICLANKEAAVTLEL